MDVSEYRELQNSLPKKNQKREEIMQVQIAKYLKLKHPDIIFRMDMGGIKLNMGQAVLWSRMQSGRAYPDCFIAEPRSGYSGLFLELKHSKNEVYRKNGELRNLKHIIEQHEMLMELTRKGYYASFSYGFDYTIELIENYLKC